MFECAVNAVYTDASLFLNFPFLMQDNECFSKTSLMHIIFESQIFYVLMENHAIFYFLTVILHQRLLVFVPSHTLRGAMLAHFNCSLHVIHLFKSCSGHWSASVFYSKLEEFRKAPFPRTPKVSTFFNTLSPFYC